MTTLKLTSFACPAAKTLACLFTAATLACGTALVHAQAYPNKAIRLVVPYPAGGTTDILARRIGASLSTSLKQPVVVDNKPGAATIIGAEAVKNAPADGYTLLVAGSTWGSNTLLYKKLPYRLDDFIPITTLIKAPYALSTSLATGQTLDAFVAQAKAQPGKLNYGTIGVGGSSHLLAEKLKKTAGIDLAEVPYKGAAPALLAIASNEVQIYFDAINTSLPQHRAGKLRILAITGDTRLPAAPDIPTFKELGMPGMTAYFWFGVMAPKDTPKPVIDLLQAEIAKALNEPEFQARMTADGAIAQAMKPDEFSNFVKADISLWGDIIKPLNIQLLE